MNQTGRHLTNIYDHRRPDAKHKMAYAPQDIKNGCGAMQIAWQDHLEWIEHNVIGPPKATAVYSQAQLEDLGMIGIYAPASIDSPIVSGPVDFNESDCGGAFDGFQVTSDADSGL